MDAKTDSLHFFFLLNLVRFLGLYLWECLHFSHNSWSQETVFPFRRASIPVSWWKPEGVWVSSYDWCSELGEHSRTFPHFISTQHLHNPISLRLLKLPKNSSKARFSSLPEPPLPSLSILLGDCFLFRLPVFFRFNFRRIFNLENLEVWDEGHSLISSKWNQKGNLDWRLGADVAGFALHSKRLFRFRPITFGFVDGWIRLCECLVILSFQRKENFRRSSYNFRDPPGQPKVRGACSLRCSFSHNLQRKPAQKVGCNIQTPPGSERNVSWERGVSSINPYGRRGLSRLLGSHRGLKIPIWWVWSWTANSQDLTLIGYEWRIKDPRLKGLKLFNHRWIQISASKDLEQDLFGKHGEPSSIDEFSIQNGSQT